MFISIIFKINNIYTHFSLKKLSTRSLGDLTGPSSPSTPLTTQEAIPTIIL